MGKEQKIIQAEKITATRKRKIKAENNRLMSLFANADPDMLDFIRDQVKQLAFFNVGIAELHEKINQFGTLVAYDNGGGQSGIRANPDVKTLTDYQKLANAIVRNLLPLLPKHSEKSILATVLDEFLSESMKSEQEQC